MKKLQLYLALLPLVAVNLSVIQNKQTLMSSNANLSIEIIRYEIPLADRPAFEAAYARAGTFLQGSLYCNGYHIIKGYDEPENYIVTIYWTSVEDHLEKFRQSEAFRSFFQLVKPYYNNIREMKHYHPPTISWNRQ